MINGDLNNIFIYEKHGICRFNILYSPVYIPVNQYDLYKTYIVSKTYKRNLDKDGFIILT